MSEPPIKEAQAAAEFAALETELRSALQAEEVARRALGDVDSAGTGAAARERMGARWGRGAPVCAAVVRSRLAYGLLAEALKRFRERAQGPILLAASRYFHQMTDGQLVRLVSDDSDDLYLRYPAQRGRAVRASGDDK